MRQTVLPTSEHLDLDEAMRKEAQLGIDNDTKALMCKR
ncbi:MAG: hypothetical protein ACJARY_000601 [Candidatus Azotimanducaceae bacterium]|jgi:hypothetical protein